MKYKTLTIVAIAFVGFIIIREIGFLKISYVNTYFENNSTVERHSISKTAARIEIPEDKISIPASIWDYVPFYKSRKVNGIVEHADGNGNKVKVTYEIAAKAKGICSGSDFRDRIKSQIVKLSK